MNIRTRRPAWAGRTAIAVAAAGGLAIGGASIAVAATGATNGTGTPPASVRPSAPAGVGSPAAPVPGRPNHARPAPGRLPDVPGNPATDADGTVTNVGSGRLTVRDEFGRSRTYQLTSGTAVHQGPGSQLRASELAAGEHVHVRGAAENGELVAVDVDVHLAHIDGVVTSVSGSTVTVRDRDGFTRQIRVGGGTDYTKAGRSVDSAAVSVGTAISAQGRVDSDGTTLDASSIDARVPPTGGPAKRGPAASYPSSPPSTTAAPSAMRG